MATVFEVGEHDDQPYIVMELVEGKPLSELIPADGLPQESVIRDGLQIADALAHAHEHGIIHRDLKSANVVVTPEGRVKVIDFGIAVPLPEAAAEAVTSTQESAMSSAPVGTLAYMAPEVLNGGDATARSDLWSLGVLLYEMASGRLPFEGEQPLDIVSAIAKETPRTLPSRVSAGLRSVVQRCLQKEPGSRYSSAAVVQGALEAVQSDSTGTPPVPVSTARKIPAGRLGVVVAGVAAAAIVGFQLWSGQQSAATVLRLTNPVQVTAAIGVEDNPSWSPDGQTLAYQSNQSGNLDIWVTQVGSGQPVNRTADYSGVDQFPS